jgi:hypothetical protein
MNCRWSTTEKNLCIRYRERAVEQENVPEGTTGKNSVLYASVGAVGKAFMAIEAESFRMSAE